MLYPVELWARVGRGKYTIVGVADGSRTRHLRSHNPVLYLMSYGHRREVLKPGYQALHRDRKVGRGREIRTPDILLPKQARYQTALYPENFARTRIRPHPSPESGWTGPGIIRSHPYFVNDLKR